MNAKEIAIVEGRIEMKKERKKPLVKTKTTNSIVNAMFGDNFATPEIIEQIKRGELGRDEYEGEGLPEKILKDGEHNFTDFTFDIRIFHDKEGTIEISAARKSSWKHTKMVYKGLNEKQACNAKRDFETNIDKMISSTWYLLISACMEKQSKSLAERRELLKKIREHTLQKYREILGLGREEIIDATEKDGVKIEHSKYNYVGRTPKTKEELEKEKQEFLDEVYSVFKEFKQKHIIKPIQKDLMRYMFKMHRDKEKKISDMLKNHNLTFDTLWLIFKATNNYDDFVSRSRMQNK